MNTESLITDETRSRAGIYGFYSGVLLREFDQDSLAELFKPQWQEVLSSLGVRTPVSQDPVEELAIDYCRIFIGPQDFCPPYQSVWESGQYQSRVVESMCEYLEVVSVENNSSIKDHAGLQFEVMASVLLFESENEGESNGLSASFFHSHIVWTEKMFRRAEQLAETDFYRDLMRVAAEFVLAEKQIYK